MNTSLLIKAYDGLVKEKSVREIHRDIRKIIQVYHHKGYEIPPKTEKFVQSIVKKAQLEPNIEAIIGLFDDTMYQKINSIGFDYERKIVGEKKEKVLRDTVRDNRWEIKNEVWDGEIPQEYLKLGMTVEEYNVYMNGRIFYLASAHEDCAEDHKDWQGKIYVDEGWRTLLQKYKVLYPMVRDYVQENNTRTMQWVIGKPVWFITRPNCRHYFKAVRIQDVLDKTVKELIKNHKMHRLIGNEEMKPIWHSTNKTWYTENNVKNIIEKYEERLDYHRKLLEVKWTQTTFNKIEKDKILIKKWKEVLGSAKKV